MADCIRVRKTGGVSEVLMDRPNVKNALNYDMFDGLLACFHDISNDPETRVLVLEGAGGNFCAGGDMALLGPEISGREAAHAGLIYRSLPESDLDAAVDSLAQTIAGKSLKALSAIKEGLENSLAMTLDEVLRWETENQLRVLQSEEHRKAVKGWMNARPEKEKK